MHSAVPGGAESRSPGASRFEVPSLWLGPSVMYIEAAVAFTKSPDFSLGAPVRAEALKPSWNIGDNDLFVRQEGPSAAGSSLVTVQGGWWFH